MNLSHMIADRRHALYDHVCRLPPETSAHRALLLSINALNTDRSGPEWKRERPRGRPRRMWLHKQTKISEPLSVLLRRRPYWSIWRSLYDPPPVMRVSDAVRHIIKTDRSQHAPFTKPNTILYVYVPGLDIFLSLPSSPVPDGQPLLVVNTCELLVSFCTDSLPAIWPMWSRHEKHVLIIA